MFIYYFRILFLIYFNWKNLKLIAYVDIIFIDLERKIDIYILKKFLILFCKNSNLVLICKNYVFI